MANPFSDALWGFYGPATVTPHVPTTASLASSSGEGSFINAPNAASSAYNTIGGVVYGLSWSTSALNSTIDWRLIDATSSGVNTPVLYQVRSLSVGHNSLTFPRPIQFSKGLCWQSCATGTSAVQMHLHWSAVNRYFSG